MRFYTQAEKQKELEKRKRYYYKDLEYIHEYHNQWRIKKMLEKEDQIAKSAPNSK